jgi:hypothetical protein
MSELDKPERRDKSSGIATGMILIVIGALFLADRFGAMDLGAWWHFWPATLIVFGVIKLVSGRDGHAWADGVVFALVGLWLLAVEFDWYGLSWSNSWPLVLIAIGASMVTKALFPRAPRTPAGTGREGGHGAA